MLHISCTMLHNNTWIYEEDLLEVGMGGKKLIE
jgi:hypothetical protein